MGGVREEQGEEGRGSLEVKGEEEGRVSDGRRKERFFVFFLGAEEGRGVTPPINFYWQ